MLWLSHRVCFSSHEIMPLFDCLKHHHEIPANCWLNQIQLLSQHCWLNPMNYPIIVGWIPWLPQIDHSSQVFDALCAHVRFDGLSSLVLVRELGSVCGFEEQKSFHSLVSQLWAMVVMYQTHSPLSAVSQKFVMSALKSTDHPEIQDRNSSINWLNWWSSRNLRNLMYLYWPQEGECTLCWVGAFPSFPTQLCNSTATWKVVDSVKGPKVMEFREGLYIYIILDYKCVKSLDNRLGYDGRANLKKIRILWFDHQWILDLDVSENRNWEITITMG